VVLSGRDPAPKTPRGNFALFRKEDLPWNRPPSLAPKSCLGSPTTTFQLVSPLGSPRSPPPRPFCSPLPSRPPVVLGVQRNLISSFNVDVPETQVTAGVCYAPNSSPVPPNRSPVPETPGSPLSAPPSPTDSVKSSTSSVSVLNYTPSSSLGSQTAAKVAWEDHVLKNPVRLRTRSSHMPTQTTTHLMQEDEGRCAICRWSVTDTCHGICCDLCDGWYHLKCVGLTKRSPAYQSAGVGWVCPFPRFHTK
jgi:hypothetical protein